MKKENVMNVVLSVTFALVAVSIIFGAIHTAYVNQKLLDIYEKQEMRRTDFSEAKFTLSVIHDVFSNKYQK